MKGKSDFEKKLFHLEIWNTIAMILTVIFGLFVLAFLVLGQIGYAVLFLILAGITRIVYHFTNKEILKFVRENLSRGGPVSFM